MGRALEELQAAGARPRRSATRAPRLSPPVSCGWPSSRRSAVTNREIAQKLFVSPKTIETHLSHAYAKLGLTGREPATA
ncbi:MAG: helix-turn-helix transcriptional regulator [Thermoleophilaceae bacterium]